MLRFSKVASIIIFLLVNGKAVCAITRADLSQQIEHDATTYLLEKANSLDLTPVLRSSAKARIQSQVKAYASTVNALPDDDINAALAEWIRISLVTELRFLGLRSLRSRTTDNALKVYKEQAQKRLAGLNEQKGQELLALQRRLIGESHEFQKAFRRYLATRLGAIPLIKIVPAQGVRPGLKDFVEALDRVRQSDEPDILKNYKHDDGILDVSNDPVDSNLATLSFMRDIRQQLDTFARIDWFSCFSITSPIFDDGDPLQLRQPKSFDTLLPSIEKLLNECIVSKGNVADVNFLRLNEVLGEIQLSLRWKDAKKKAESPKSEPASSIIFQNNSKTWNYVLSPIPFFEEYQNN